MDLPAAIMFLIARLAEASSTMSLIEEQRTLLDLNEEHSRSMTKRNSRQTLGMINELNDEKELEDTTIARRRAIENEIIALRKKTGDFEQVQSLIQAPTGKRRQAKLLCLGDC